MLKLFKDRNIFCPAVRLLTTESYKADIFENEFKNHHIQTSLLQKAVLTVGSAAASILNPHRGDMIACLGETTGYQALKFMLRKMEMSEEGGEILKLRPRINSKTVNLEKLKTYPEGTLGKVYSNFLETNICKRYKELKNAMIRSLYKLGGSENPLISQYLLHLIARVTPDSRMTVQFVDDVNLAYVIQRYREVHDLIHTILGMPTNMLGEVTVKWVEALQTGLPMCVGGAIFGPVRLKAKHRQLYLQHHLPWAIQTGKKTKFLLNIFFEKRWDQQLSELHEEMNIWPLVIPK